MDKVKSDFGILYFSMVSDCLIRDVHKCIIFSNLDKTLMEGYLILEEL